MSPHCFHHFSHSQPADGDVSIYLRSDKWRLDDFLMIRYSLNNQDPEMHVIRLKHVETLKKEGWKVVNQVLAFPLVSIQFEN